MKRSTPTLVILLCLAAACAVGGEGAASPADTARQVNLLAGPGFEFAGTTDEAAKGWLLIGEDQMADWEKASYVIAQRGTLLAARRHEGAARSGQYGLRLFGADRTICAVWQRIELLQTQPKPILLVAWSRLDGAEPLPARVGAFDLSIWGEFGIANVRHMDGTKAEISRGRPLIDLSRGHGEWTLAQAIYVPTKPVRYLEVKVDLHGAGPATLLCVDDLLVAEVDSTVAELEARGVKVPAMNIAPAPAWVSPEATALEIPLIDQDGRGRPLARRLRLSITSERDELVLRRLDRFDDDEALELLIAPYDRKPFDMARAADFYRFRFSKDGSGRFAWALTRNERALGAPEDAAFFLPRSPSPHPSAKRPKANAPGSPWTVRIPFDTIEESAPRAAAWRINIARRRGDEVACSAPTYSREQKFGRLLLRAPEQQPSPLAIERVEVLAGDVGGEKVPPYALANGIPWGDVPVSVSLAWRGPAGRPATLLCDAGSGQVAHLPITLEPGRHQHSIPVQFHGAGLRHLNVRVRDRRTDQTLARLVLPVTVRPLLTPWMYERFLYADEDAADVYVWIGAADAAAVRTLRTHVEDIRGRRIGRKATKPAGTRGPLKLSVPVNRVKVNDEPIADHWIVAEALDKRGKPMGSARLRIGRIPRRAPRQEEPIKSVQVNGRGYLAVNGKPFFAVVASLNVRNAGRGYRRTPRLGFNAAKVNCGPEDKAIVHTDMSVRKLYTDLYQGGVYAAPFIWIRREDPERRQLLDWLKASPAFLLVVGGEVYRDTAHSFDHPDWLVYPQRPVLAEYHNSGTWLDVVRHGKPIVPISMVPFTSWDASATRKLLADYARERAVRAQTGLITSIVVCQNPYSSIWDVRAFCYLSAIYGGTGAYLYIVADKGDPEDDRIEELTRGLAAELRLMGPVFTAVDQRRTVRVSPAGAGLQVGWSSIPIPNP